MTAIPPALFASVDPDEARLPRLNVTIASDDQGLDLEVTPEPAPEGMELRRLDRSSRQSSFEISFSSAKLASSARAIAFRTNHPKMPVVRVPLLVSISGPEDPTR